MRKILTILLLFTTLFAFGQEKYVLTSGKYVLESNGSVVIYIVPEPVINPIRVYNFVDTTNGVVFWLDSVANDTAKFTRFPVANLNQATSIITQHRMTYIMPDTALSYVNITRNNHVSDQNRLYMGGAVQNRVYGFNVYRPAPAMQVRFNGSEVVVNWSAGIDRTNQYILTGWGYSSVDSLTTAYWDNLSNSSGPKSKLLESTGEQYFQTFANESDVSKIALAIYDRELRDAEFDSVRLHGIYPSDSLEYFFNPAGGYYDLINRYTYESVDGAIGRWYTQAAFSGIPTSLYDSTATNIWAAYPLLHGYLTRGVHHIAYLPNKVKGNITGDDQTQHEWITGSNNRYLCYVDFNPNDADSTLAQYKIWDKANRAVWKSSIETVNEGEDYIQNDNGDYTLWHNERELTYEYVQTHIETAYLDFIQFDYELEGDSIVTHINRIYVYEETAPVIDQVTKDTILFYSIYGNSVMNSLSSYIDTASGNNGPTVADKNKYFYAGADSTYSYVLRWGGGMYDPPENVSTFDMLPLYYKENCYYQGGVLDRFGVETPFSIDLYDSIGGSNLIAIQHYSENGTGMMDEAATASWNVNEATASLNLFTLAYTQYKQSKKYLENMGYYVKDMGVIMAGQATVDTWSVTDDGYTSIQYKADVTAFVDSMRVLRGNVPFYWYEPTVLTDLDRDTIIDANADLEVSITKFYSFDLDAWFEATDDIHPMGTSQMNIGKNLVIFVRTKEQL